METSPPVPPTPPSSTVPIANPDEIHLDALAIAHYVVGGLGVLFGLIPLVYVCMGMFFIFGADKLNHAHNATAGGPPTMVFGVLFAVLGGFFFLLFQTIAICLIVSGRALHQRRRRTFSFVFACIACAWVPFGTILGVFTLVVLSRPSVQTLYARNSAPPV